MNPVLFGYTVTPISKESTIRPFTRPVKPETPSFESTSDGTICACVWGGGSTAVFSYVYVIRFHVTGLYLPVLGVHRYFVNLHRSDLTLPGIFYKVIVQKYD